MSGKQSSSERAPCNGDAHPLIVVIDSDLGIRRAATALFGSHGWRAKTYACAEDYFADADKTDAPACVVTDLMLPGIRGLDLLYKLREINPGVPILFMTAYPDAEIATDLRESAVDVLFKPVEGDSLVSRITHAMASTGRVA